jgi:cellulose biosynthesis protein BcsQ
MLNTDRKSQRLYKSALALVQLKGGAGKTTLLANLAAIAAQSSWTTVVVDLDSNAPLTGSVLGSYTTQGTVIEALERVGQGEPVDDLLVYAPNLGVYLLQGDIRGVPPGYLRWIPDLVAELKAAYVSTPQGARPVDCILIDTPGDNRGINLAVLQAVDYIALPAMVSSADVAATGITLQIIVQAQAERAGEPVFLGLIPNRVPRRGSIERTFVDVVLKGGKILPYIPASETLRANLSRRSAAGGEAAVQYAPRSVVAARLQALWEALNTPERDYPAYAEDFCRYIGAKGANAHD